MPRIACAGMSALVSPMGCRCGAAAEGLNDGRDCALPDFRILRCGGPIRALKKKQGQDLGVPQLRRGGGPIPALKKKQGQDLEVPRLRRGVGPIPVVVGFTLIELLVVVVIIAVLALAVTISIATAGGERQLVRESERVQALIAHACNQAELTGREIGVRITHNGYAFALLGFDGWMASEQKDELRARTWIPGMQVALYRDGSEMRLADDESQPPQIVCFSSGELSPFVLRLALGDAAKRYEVRGKADGRIDIESMDTRP